MVRVRLYADECIVWLSASLPLEDVLSGHCCCHGVVYRTLDVSIIEHHWCFCTISVAYRTLDVSIVMIEHHWCFCAIIMAAQCDDLAKIVQVLPWEGESDQMSKMTKSHAQVVGECQFCKCDIPVTL
jgi:hypothetical protein